LIGAALAVKRVFAGIQQPLFPSSRKGDRLCGFSGITFVE
jgi:hypothetical protein